MTFNIMQIDLNTLISGVLAALIAAGVKALFGIRDHLATLNNRVGKIETWADGHEKSDDERWRQVQDQFEKLPGQVVTEIFPMIEGIKKK